MSSILLSCCESYQGLATYTIVVQLLWQLLVDGQVPLWSRSYWGLSLLYTGASVILTISNYFCKTSRSHHPSSIPSEIRGKQLWAWIYVKAYLKDIGRQCQTGAAPYNAWTSVPIFRLISFGNKDRNQCVMEYRLKPRWNRGQWGWWALTASLGVHSTGPVVTA